MADKSSENKKLQYTNQIFIVLLIGAIFTIGLFWQKIQNLEKNSKSGTVAGAEQAKPTSPPVADVAPVGENDHIRGDKSAPVTWIEYSDLQCPFCASIHSDMIKLMKEYNGKVRWVYRHFPLEQLHPYAKKLAYGAECVAKEKGNDAFWKYVDYVFKNKSTDPEAVVEALGINNSSFTSCLSSAKIAKIVENDYNSGVSAGVRGTPGNFILGPNGKKQSIPGALPYEQLKAAVDAVLSN